MYCKRYWCDNLFVKKRMNMTTSKIMFCFTSKLTSEWILMWSFPLVFHSLFGLCIHLCLWLHQNQNSFVFFQSIVLLILQTLTEITLFHNTFVYIRLLCFIQNSFFTFFTLYYNLKYHRCKFLWGGQTDINYDEVAIAHVIVQ